MWGAANNRILHELNVVMSNVSDLPEVCKMLVQSTNHDVIALVTIKWNYPLIIFGPGKVVWLPIPIKKKSPKSSVLTFLVTKL